MPVHSDPNPSEKGLEVLRMIISHVEIHGYQPSQQEMADALGVSKNAIQGRLKELARRNILSLPEGNRERAVVLHYVRFKAYNSSVQKPAPNEVNLEQFKLRGDSHLGKKVQLPLTGPLDQPRMCETGK